MKRTPALPHMVAALLLLLPLSCATSPARGSDDRRPQAEPRAVSTSALRGGRLRVSFDPVTPDPALEVLRMEETQKVLAALGGALPSREKSRLRLVLTSTGAGEGTPSEWE